MGFQGWFQDWSQESRDEKALDPWDQSRDEKALDPWERPGTRINPSNLF
jgi:hypothetical protein